MTEFGRLSSDGYEHVGTLNQSDMLKCPFCIIDFEHYRPDGTCKCNDPIEQTRLIRDYDYTPEDFSD